MLTLILVFHHIAQLPGGLGQIALGPRRIRQTVEHSKFKSTQPNRRADGTPCSSLTVFDQPAMMAFGLDSRVPKSGSRSAESCAQFPFGVFFWRLCIDYADGPGAVVNVPFAVIFRTASSSEW